MTLNKSKLRLIISFIMYVLLCYVFIFCTVVPSVMLFILTVEKLNFVIAIMCSVIAGLLINKIISEAKFVSYIPWMNEMVYLDNNQIIVKTIVKGTHHLTYISKVYSIRKHCFVWEIKACGCCGSTTQRENIAMHEIARDLQDDIQVPITVTISRLYNGENESKLLKILNQIKN